MPHGADLTIIDAFNGQENCFVWKQLLEEELKIC